MRSSRMTVRCWTAAVALAMAVTPGLARQGGAAGAAAAESAGERKLAGLEFMAGCWRSGDGGRYVEEVYLRPTANLMLGVSVTVRDGRAVEHELIRVEASGDRVLMTPYPGGIASPHAFALTTLRPGEEAIFEAPEHDYPKRILYRRNPDGTRTARIDGGPEDGEGMEWRFPAAACPAERPASGS
jgi:hypothetical protein